MKYSKVSDPPSLAPSETPSSIPSSQPSESPSISSVPSAQPSGAPSSAPSEGPSLSGLPSITAMPSTSSEAPSDEPSISHVPTVAPSEVPSLVPTTPPSDVPSKSMVPTANTEARVQISIPSQITIGGFNIPQTEAEISTIISIVVPSIADLINADLQPGQVLRRVVVTRVNGIAVDESFSFRRLQSVSRRLDNHIDIEYRIDLEEVCDTQGCNDAQQIANALYESVTDNMQAEIDSGAFAQAVEQEALVVLNQQLDLQITEPVFADLVITVLALLSLWYPSWTNGEYCRNDGDYREYRSLIYLWIKCDVCPFFKS